MKNIPRASIHVGDPAKSFSAAEGAEPERRGWDEEMYNRKNNGDRDNHYDFSRSKFNFEIDSQGNILRLGSNPIPLHERVKIRLDELGFKPYFEKDHPDVIADNSPNCTLTMIFSGDHDTLHRLAYGDQDVDLTLQKSNADITIQQGIYDWARDTHRFVCDKYGAENVIGFDVHLDETTPHVQVQIIPVAKTKTRGRIGYQYRKKDDPSVILSTEKWKKLPKEQQGEYDKVEKSKTEKECVSYAEVFGKNKYEVKATYSNLHTEYHEKVGCKYGLERGFTEEELTEEEQRGRVHKDKHVLEAERFAKANIAQMEADVNALEAKKTKIEQQTEDAKKRKSDAEKDAKAAELFKELANIAEVKLPFPKFTIDEILTTAKNTINDELAIPIPMMNQKEWRVERQKNIKQALTDMQTNLGTAKGEYVEDIKSHCKDIFKYYKQELKKLVKENETLRKENKTLSAQNSSLQKENYQLKAKISKIDENAIEKVRTEKDSQISELKTKLSSETKRANTAEANLAGLHERWKIIWSHPEMRSCWDEIVKREKEQKAEQDRKEHEKKERYNAIIDGVIAEGRKAQRDFALYSRSYDFNDNEARRVYCALIALATKHNQSLQTRSCIENVVKRFLDGCDWSGMTGTRISSHRSWTNIFATRDVNFEQSNIDTFLSIVDEMSGSAENNVSLGGSNGCADQLTNWDGTKKLGLAAPEKKKRCGMSR